ncbi:hypothetical protein [Ferrovibrio xuzhouensis]|uniref:Uncharacterized protein n=1 Tax=Ferrovibrio xuzhouensis TaxID=1576914 RepID=A0ABV7VHP9_9PROT
MLVVMGDRYFHPRHPNLELLLRRSPDFAYAGIGHNGGPPLDMSFRGWAWRRALGKVWETPPREIALRRLARAEKLGLGYRDYTAALLDTGCHLSAAILPLHYLLAGAGLQANPHVAAHVARFGGRLLLLVDEAAFGPLDRAARKALASRIAALGIVADLLVLPFRLDEGDRQRGRRLRRLLATKGVQRHEIFMLGSTAADLALARETNLGTFVPLARWFAGA